MKFVSKLSVNEPFYRSVCKLLKNATNQTVKLEQCSTMLKQWFTKSTATSSAPKPILKKSSIPIAINHEQLSNLDHHDDSSSSHSSPSSHHRKLNDSHLSSSNRDKSIRRVRFSDSDSDSDSTSVSGSSSPHRNQNHHNNNIGRKHSRSRSNSPEDRKRRRDDNYDHRDETVIVKQESSESSVKQEPNEFAVKQEPISTTTESSSILPLADAIALVESIPTKPAVLVSELGFECVFCCLLSLIVNICFTF